MVALVLALAPSNAAEGSDVEPCPVWDIEYALSGKLQLSDTPLNAGNGVYPVGPGTLVLRFDRREGHPQVALVSYRMPERFRVDAKWAFWTTHVTTNATTRATPPGPCGHVAEGAMHGNTLTWTTGTQGYRTDGTLSCNGSLCGSHGAPPRGTSPLHVGPTSVRLRPFEFSPDGKTFTMASTFVSKTESPKQTAHLTLAGRQVRRSCARVDACR